MSVWLVTGGSGFLGRHLLAGLADRRPAGSEIIALGRRCPPSWPASAFVQADLEDGSSLARALANIEPSVVLHAAGKTPPAPPDELFRANTRATVALLGALRACNRPVRVVLAGSAAELGPVEVDDLPAGEGHRCRPRDAYGLSKWFATLAGLACGAPLEVMVARIFNMIGPGMPPSQAFGRFAQQLAGPELGPLRLVVGDLESKRDFIDVRDVAQAMICLALHGRPGMVYHVGTGRSKRVGDGLAHLIRLSGRGVELESDRSLTAAGGPTDSRADTRLIAEHTGWAPRIDWLQSLADLWDEVRAHTTGIAPSHGRLSARPRSTRP